MTIEPMTEGGVTLGWHVTCDSEMVGGGPCTFKVDVGLGIPVTLAHLEEEITHQGWAIAHGGDDRTRYHCPNHVNASKTAFIRALSDDLLPPPPADPIRFEAMRDAIDRGYGEFAGNVGVLRCPQCDSIGETGCPNPYHDQDRSAAYARSEPERRIVGFEISDRFGEPEKGLISQLFRRSELPWDARIIDAAYSRIVRNLDSEEPSLWERFIIVAAYPLCAYSAWRIRRVVTWRSE